jgi:hypothetical protein
MQKQICDICKIRDATKKFKVKRSTRFLNQIAKNYFKFSSWSGWENIDICDECGEKLFYVAKNKGSHESTEKGIK